MPQMNPPLYVMSFVFLDAAREWRSLIRADAKYLALLYVLGDTVYIL